MWARLARGTGANAFGQIVIAAVQLTTVPVLATHWGVERYGLWILLFTVPAYLALGDLGFATAAGIEMTIAVGKNDCRRAVAIFQSAFMFIICAALLLFASGVVIIGCIPGRLLATSADVSPADMRITLAILLAYGVVSLASSIVLAGYRCAGLYAAGTMTQSFVQLAEGLGCIALVLAGASIIEVSIGYLLVRSTSVLVQAILLGRLAPWLRFGFTQASRDEVVRLLHPALAVLALSGGQAAILLGTALTLGAATDAATVAVFTTTRTLIRTGIQLTGLLNRALMPEFSNAVGRGDIEAQQRMLVLTVLSSLAILVPSGLVLAFGGHRIITLWTHGTIHVGETFLLLMVAVMIVEGLWYPVSNLILSANKQTSYAYAFVSAAVISLALSYPLARTSGASGSATAILVTEVFMLVYIARLASGSMQTFFKPERFKVQVRP